MHWRIGAPYNDYTGVIDGVVVVVNGVVETDEISKIPKEVALILGKYDAIETEIKPKEPVMVVYELGGKFQHFTGKLNGIYDVKDGLVILQDELEQSGSKIIREHYSALKCQLTNDEPPKVVRPKREAVKPAAPAAPAGGQAQGGQNGGQGK